VKIRRRGFELRIKKTFFYRALKLINRADRRKILFLGLVQSLLGILDLIGVAAIGVLTALTVNGIQSRPPGDRVLSVLKLLQLQGLTFSSQVALLGITSMLTLVLRTLASIYLTRFTLRFLSRISASLSSDLTAKLFNQPLMYIQSRTTSETMYSLNAGVTSIVVGFISVVVTTLSDLSSLIILSVGLLTVNFSVAISSFAVFALVGIILYRLQHSRASKLAQDFTSASISRDTLVYEALTSYRELVVRNRRKFYVDELQRINFGISNLQAEISFLPLVNKYVIEITIVLGTFLISAVQFIYQDLTHAVSTLVIFSAAASRIAPSVIRIQQSLITLKSSSETAKPTLDLIENLSDQLPAPGVNETKDFEHKDFVPEIRVKNISFSYPGAERKAISDVSFDIANGEFIAVVGRSGSGKSTLVDLILGVLEPDFGSIEISHNNPLAAIAKWPGAIAYVPQDVYISNRSILENVSLGYSENSDTGSSVAKALDLAELSELVTELPNGMQSTVGERGAKLSGGQKQRLGIARALFSQPKLLVLDEATSSLDAETELRISNSLLGLKGKITIVVIAHRLSTIRNADKVIYIENSKVLQTGTFEEIRAKVPDFDRQANLMGLNGNTEERTSAH
jgi:ABC-type bacteriocin/lantibiotic exporter with double-glycine peptidase domain